jgi:hypothetical protein
LKPRRAHDGRIRWANGDFFVARLTLGWEALAPVFVAGAIAISSSAVVPLWVGFVFH